MRRREKIPNRGANVLCSFQSRLIICIFVSNFDLTLLTHSLTLSFSLLHIESRDIRKKPNSGLGLKFKIGAQCAWNKGQI